MKKIALFLCICLSLGMLTACAGGDKPAETTAATTAATTEATTTEATTTEATTTEATTTEATTTEATTAQLTPADIEAAIAAALGDGYLCDTDISAEDLPYVVYDLDVSQIESFVAKENAIPSLFMDEVIVLQCKEGYADTAVALLNETYANLVSYGRLYPFNLPKVEGARLYKLNGGNTVVFVLAGADPETELNDEDAAAFAAAEYEKIDQVLFGLCEDISENLAIVPEATDSGSADYDSENPPLVGGF